MEKNKIRNFVNAQEWRFAKTYAKTAPHYYIIKGKLPKEEQETFIDFVKHIREKGYEELFWTKSFIMFRLDGFVYWTYGDPIPDTIVLNRRKIDEN